MKRGLKWIGIVIGGFPALVFMVVPGLRAKSRLEFTHRHAVQVEAVRVATDGLSIERGKHLPPSCAKRVMPETWAVRPSFSTSTPSLRVRRRPSRQRATWVTGPKHNSRPRCAPPAARRHAVGVERQDDGR
jgi:hypothetical protein